MTTTPPPAATFISQTPYQTALAAHSGQSPCPTPGDRNLPSWYVDEKYEYCCRTQYGANYIETLTSGPGPHGKSLTACCPRSYLCTGAAPFVFDWFISTEVVSLSERSFVRPTIITFPLTTTQVDGGGGNSVPVTAPETATVTVTITTPAVIIVGGENAGHLTNGEVAGTVVGVGCFFVALFTLYLGYKNPPAWLQPLLEKLGIGQPHQVVTGDPTPT